jgi:hypothetical protein
MNFNFEVRVEVYIGPIQTKNKIYVVTLSALIHPSICDFRMHIVVAEMKMWTDGCIDICPY